MIVIFVIAAMSLLDNKTNPTLRVITKNMMRSVEQSLKRLQVDFVDVLYLHIWDDLTLDEILRGLMILSNRESKLYRHQWYAGLMVAREIRWQGNGLEQFIALQVEYSLLKRCRKIWYLWLNISAWPLLPGPAVGHSPASILKAIRDDTASVFG